MIEAKGKIQAIMLTALDQQIWIFPNSALRNRHNFSPFEKLNDPRKPGFSNQAQRHIVRTNGMNCEFQSA